MQDVLSSACAAGFSFILHAPNSFKQLAPCALSSEQQLTRFGRMSVSTRLVPWLLLALVGCRQAFFGQRHGA